MKTLIKTLLMAALAATFSLKSFADEDITIRRGANYVVPICVKGFSGEAESVLGFDLYVLGFELTSQEKADFTVIGSNSGRVEGRLLPKGSTTPVFSRAYTGGNLRVQAHALADDIITALGRKGGIFRGKIAYRSGDLYKAEIVMADFDNNHPITLTHDGALVGGASWVPGGHILLYTTWMSGYPNIIEHEIATGMRKNLIKPVGSAFSAAVSPDGRRVAMILNRSGNPDLWVCDINGANLKQLTHTPQDESSPCWSPNGQEICYTHNSGRAALYKINVNTGASERLRTSGAFGNITEPDWSPDGEKIIFTSGSGNFSLFVMPARGGEAEQLVAGEDPCWGPNSRTVIFTRRVNNKRVLSLLDVPTKHVKDVTQISGSCSQPCWAR